MELCVVDFESKYTSPGIRIFCVFEALVLHICASISSNFGVPMFPKCENGSMIQKIFLYLVK
jgi:hypothetical protein